jgi:hypothetical protein
MPRIRCGVVFSLLATAWSAGAQETVLSRTYVRDKAGPTSFSDSFAVCDPAGKFTLSIDNGPAGAAQVSSASIAVNGVEIFRQSDFNQQVSHLESPLSGIAATNQISVSLTSNPGGTLAVAVIGVMSCGIKIKSPASGALLTAPEVLVKGTVPLSYGIGAGITVNGAVAAITPGTFAALVRIDETVAALTATATDATGKVLSKDSIPVAVQPSTGSVRLLIGSAGGLAPLAETFTLASDLPIAQASLDFEGDGVVDFTGASVSGVPFTYLQPGLYLPVVTAIDTAGATHTATGIVLVSDRASIEALLQARWGAMKDALRRGDIASAGQLIVPSARDRYVNGFTAMAAALPNIDAILTPISLVDVRGRIAILEMLRTDAGIAKSFEVRCALDDDGIWRLRAF